MLQIVRMEGLTVDASQLSVNIRHNLAKALIRRNAGDELDLDRAKELVDGLMLVWCGQGEANHRMHQRSIGCIS